MMHKLVGWRRHVRPKHVLWVLIGTNLVVFVFSLLWKLGIFSLLMNVFSVLLVVCSLTVITNRESYVKLWAWITGLTAVKIMDYAHEVRYTLVEHQADGTWTGHLNFSLPHGLIKLWPNGHVDPDCECAFCYIWHPLDADLKTHLQLTHWELWPDWHVWLEKSHQDMIIYRSSKWKA